VLTGLFCAVAAALAYGSASVLQSIGIRRAGAKGVGASGLAGLKGQPLYFIGLALDGAGFFAMVVALQFLPLFLGLAEHLRRFDCLCSVELWYVAVWCGCRSAGRPVVADQGPFG